MKQRRCGHCSLLGHYISACHVLLEGRHRPDSADELACEALLNQRADAGTRGAVAALVRGLGEDAQPTEHSGPERAEDADRSGRPRHAPVVQDEPRHAQKA